jgi:hypothetical protein
MLPAWMLRDLKDRVVTEVHDRREFERLCQRLDSAELAAIHAELRSRLDATPMGSATAASWISAPDWAGSPFQPIYNKVCPGSYEQSGMFLGHLMKQAVIDHPGDWRMAKKPRNPGDPEGIWITLYWRER